MVFMYRCLGPMFNMCGDSSSDALGGGLIWGQYAYYTLDPHTSAYA